MTQEEKELLLKDLSARLPYHVKVKVWLKEGTTEEGLLDLKHNYGDVLRDAFYYNIIKDIKPYLRPMSSMTEEEKHELLKFGTVNLDRESNAIDVCCVGFNNHAKVQDYLNSIHIDYRGLIPKGFAIAVTEENNPYKD